MATMRYEGSKQANAFVKALEQYVENEGTYFAIGFEMSNLLSQRLENRWLLMYDGYKAGQEVNMRGAK